MGRKREAGARLAIWRALLLTVTMGILSPAAEPPRARQVPRTMALHGDQRDDPYFWLRDDARKNPAVLAYLEAENAYAAEALKPAAALQEKLNQEIVGRIQQTDESVPYRKGGYWYYSRTIEGKQYSVECRKKGSLSAAEEILLDQNAMAEGQKYFRVANATVSPDERLLAYGVDGNGDEVYTLYVKDLASGKVLEDRVPGAYYTLAWAHDNRTLFYTVVDAAKRPYKVFRHTLGAPAGSDVEVYHEPDERFEIEIQKSKDDAFIFLKIDSKTTSEYRYLPANEAAASPRVLYARRADIEYTVESHGESFFVRINDKGRNYRLVRVAQRDPDLARGVEVVPHRADAYLEAMDVFAGHLALLERYDGLRRIRVLDLRSGKAHAIDAPEPAYVFGLEANPEFHTASLRFSYSSLVTPRSVFDYDMDRRTRELKKRQPVLGGYDESQYATERVFAAAADGTRIPIALVYRKNLFRGDGSNPALLYGYGAYGLNSEPLFVSDRLSLLDRGFVYAVASIRGGSEMGKVWHDTGRMFHKRNSFADFIAAAGHLVARKYTQPKKLAIYGGSAGGLLMGAVVNLRPDLFGAVIAKVPFVDVLNTMLDKSLPLTVGEFEEWGNPEDEKSYRYIRTYSPYDNVERQEYPHMLVTAGLNDPRVSYWEPAKWVARLRERKKGANLLLLKTNMGAGHFGASGRYERYRETALDYTFLIHTVGGGAQ